MGAVWVKRLVNEALLIPITVRTPLGVDAVYDGPSGVYLVTFSFEATPNVPLPAPTQFLLNVVRVRDSLSLFGNGAVRVTEMVSSVLQGQVIALLQLEPGDAFRLFGVSSTNPCTLVEDSGLFAVY